MVHPAAGSLGGHPAAAPRPAGCQAPGAVLGGHRLADHAGGGSGGGARGYRAHEHRVQVLPAGVGAVCHQRGGRPGLAAAAAAALAARLAHGAGRSSSGMLVFCRGAVPPDGRDGEDQGPHELLRGQPPTLDGTAYCPATWIGMDYPCSMGATRRDRGRHGSERRITAPSAGCRRMSAARR